MKYPLEDLLRVRKFREDDKATELTRCRTAVEVAEHALASRQRELEEYIAWRVQREEQIYQEVLEKKIAKRDLDAMKVSIQILRDEEVVYEQKVLAAKNELSQAREAVAAAQQAYRAAVRDSQKIEEHKQMWAQEAAQEHEAFQEKELEDFRVRSLETEEVNDVP